MKNKTLTILLTILLISSFAFAQKTKWGIQAGASFANVTLSVDGEVESDDYKAGFTAGIMMDHQIGKKLYFQPALNFVQKGAQSDEDYMGKATTTLNYLELPLNFVFRPKPQSGFMFGGGPSIGCGLGGMFKMEDIKESIDFGGENNPDLLELEANLLAGYKFSKVQVTLSYNFGITSLTDNDYARMKNNYFGLRIGYYFK